MMRKIDYLLMIWGMILLPFAVMIDLIIDLLVFIKYLWRIVKDLIKSIL